MDYRRGIVTPESVWRALILYGANSATYKFAFGRALLDVARPADQTHVSLEDLAPRYADLLCEALQRQPRQGTASRSKFLETCRSYNAGQLDRETLLQRTAQLGFVNVVEAFPRIQGGDAPIRFYEDRRKDPKVRGLVLTDELLALAQSFQAANLQGDTVARWRLVETAWATGVSSGLLLPVLGYDSATEALTIGEARRRRSVSGAREAISGYQDGRCAYCDEPMAFRASGQVIVEHVLPWQLLTKGWYGPDVDSVWNLVLACHTCNSEKSGRAPVESWMPWLERRNNDFIASNHPLRETLIVQTGRTVEERRSTLKRAYEQATALIPVLWKPTRTNASPSFGVD